MRTSHVSLLLRVLPEPATRGELIGRVEVVETGETVMVHSPEDLIRLLQRLVGVTEVAAPIAT